MALIPNSEVYDGDGNVTHFGIIDPINGEPSLIPHIGGNYAMFGGGSGATQLSNGGNGGGISSDTPDMPINLNNDTASGDSGPGVFSDLASGVGSAVGNAATQLSHGGFSPSAASSPPPPAAAVPVTSPMALADTPRVGAAPNNPKAGNSAMFTGPGGATMTPALMAQMTTTQNGTSQAQVDPAQMAKLDSATGKIKEAIDAGADATIAESKVRQAQAEADHNAIVEQQQAQQAARASYEANVAKKQQEIQESTDKFINTPLDANHFWADKGTGDKVMAGVAIALGALGGALQGSNGNVGLEVINKAIERDLKVQELNMQKSKMGIEMKRGLLSDYMAQYGDAEKAKEAAFIAYQKGVARHFDAMAESARDPGTKAMAAKVSAELDANNAMRIADLTKKTVSSQTTTAPMAKGAPLGSKEQDELAELERVHNRLGNVIETVNNNKDKFGKVANTEASIAQFLGLPKESTKASVDFALQQVLTDGLVAKRRGVFTPGTAEEVKDLQKQIGSNPETMVNVLNGFRNDVSNIVDSRRRGYGSTGSILPVDQRTQTLDEQRKDLLKKK